MKIYHFDVGNYSRMEESLYYIYRGLDSTVLS